MEDSTEQSDQPPPTSLAIHGDVDENYNWLKEHAIAALAILGKDKSTVSVRIVDDSLMSALHAKHSGIDEPTDVLTFDNGSNDLEVNADIAVCSDVALRESEKHGHSLQEELLLYIVHGILHCCGFDDLDEASNKKMHAEEDRILSAIGVGKVWSRHS